MLWPEEDYTLSTQASCFQTNILASALSQHSFGRSEPCRSSSELRDRHLLDFSARDPSSGCPKPPWVQCGCLCWSAQQREQQSEGQHHQQGHKTQLTQHKAQTATLEAEDMPGFAHTSKSFCDCAPNTHYLTSYRVLLSALTPGWTNTPRNWEGIGCCSPVCRACTWACWEAPRSPCQLGSLHTAPAA